MQVVSSLHMAGHDCSVLDAMQVWIGSDNGNGNGDMMMTGRQLAALRDNEPGGRSAREGRHRVPRYYYYRL